MTASHSSPRGHGRARRRFVRWEAHQRFFVAGGAALLAGFLAPWKLDTRLVFGWDVYALVTLVLCWLGMLLTDPYEARRDARLQDAGRTFLFVFVITAATASLLAVGLLLGEAKGKEAAELKGHVALSLAAVFLSWALVHTLFALRYAHHYYADAQTKSREHIDGGLDFPGKLDPDYLDFAYFSFVVGMTAQVSDVPVTSRQVRRVTLIHGLISFFFNTAILAIFVNIVAGLL
ncbi:MAG TPA: DUF1345 domain-containing protein [Candidatus Methylacidiphilales bacterium]